MNLIQKLIMLDQCLSVRPAQPVAPRVPTKAETDLKAAMRHDNKCHAKVIEAAGVYRA